MLALREGKEWRFIGHVSTGFNHEILKELHGKLIKLKMAKSPFPRSSANYLYGLPTGIGYRRAWP